jgi:hypothetical protein
MERALPGQRRSVLAKPVGVVAGYELDALLGRHRVIGAPRANSSIGAASPSTLRYRWMQPSGT